MEDLPHDDEPVLADDLRSASSGHAGNADQILLWAEDRRGQAEIDSLPVADRTGDQPVRPPQDPVSTRGDERCLVRRIVHRLEIELHGQISGAARSAPPWAADARSATAARGPASRPSAETALGPSAAGRCLPPAGPRPRGVADRAGARRSSRVREASGCRAPATRSQSRA